MAVPVEEGVLNALRGVVNETTRLPKPLLIKVYVSSLKDEFKEERRMILELIGPELQALYDDRQVEIELIDMHFGTGPDDVSMVEIDPTIMQDYLFEIERCHKHSKSVFFIALVGEGIGRSVPPCSIANDVFDAICGRCDATGRDILRKCYHLSENDGKYSLSDVYRNQSIADDRIRDSRKLTELLERGCDELLKMPSNDQGFIERLKLIRRTQIEMEIEKALELSPDRIIVIFREWSNQINSPSTNIESRDTLRHLKDRLTLSLPTDNYTTLIVPGKSSNRTIDIDSEDHEIYLSKFKNKLLNKMSNSIEQSLTNDPDVIKGRKKTVQEIFHEHSTHLRFHNEHLDAKALISSSIPDRLRTSVLQNYRTGSRHSPYFLQGTHGTGKSTLVSDLYSKVGKWFEYTKVHRIIRFASATPRSAYSLELLRVICQQLSIIINIPEGYLPKDASFDPLYISNWFQNLLRRCEDLNNEILFLFIDDLHRLNPLDCDNVAALSWLPISLPYNVFIVCSTTIPMDQLKFTPIQKDRFKSAEFLFDLAQEANRTELRRIAANFGGESFEEEVRKQFDYLEGRYGAKGFGRMAAYITCSEYGLTETELLELLMPTESSDAIIATTEGNFNFSSFRKIRNEMGLLIREKIMSGRIVIEWRHQICAELARSRYIDANSRRTMHTEIANIFFSHLAEESDVTTTEKSESEDSQKLKDEKPSPNTHQDDTSTIFNPPGADVSYSIRHVEESWHHLMRSEDTAKFKQIAVCNFDFLLASVQTVSISYLRCLIEHVRCHILDRDIELIYYTIRKSSDVLTRDPMQLGAQLISWLRPINEHDENDNSLLSITVRSATAWCDGYTVPLLVPMTGWLPVPLPSQIRTMTVSGTGPIRDIAVAPSKQHLIFATKVGDAQMWHIMSNSLVHTFKGHTAPVTCMVVPLNSNLLVTGSEDSSIMVWNVNNRTLKAHVREHIAAVLCVTCAMNNTLAISGGDDSRIIIADLNTGKVLGKIDNHRGPVTSVQVSAASDVLVSASHDATVCLWSLDDYTLLNCFQIHSPIFGMRISCDSVFLLAHCADNGLYLRTLATGTELHALKGHKSKVRTMAIAMDSQRAIIGCDDTRALIFDMHSGRLVRSLPPNPGPVTALYVLENDDFLITVGGNKITFYSFRNEEIFVNPYTHHRRKKHSKSILPPRSTNPANVPPVTCFDVSRDSQLAAVASSKNIHIMQINSPELQGTLDGHMAAVTCVNFSPNCEFLASGSEDKTVMIWNLQLALAATTFKGHSATITCVTVLMDSRRIISSDKDSTIHVWLADSATLLQTIQGPNKFLSATNNMKFAVCTNGDNSLKIWSLTREDEKYTVSHSSEITCFAITADSLYVITGSRDMSLKVWQATGGKLAQVLVGHSDAVTCVAVSVTNKTQVISGSKDCNLIVWDIHTGDEIHTLAGHLAQVTCVKVSADGTTAVSGSDDKTLIVWETKRGLALTSLQIHMPFIRFDISLECSRILVQLVDNFHLPVICLHNTPASFVKLPTYSAPARDAEDLRPAGPKRQMKRLLKKEVSLDTYTWQKKYGHLTSSVMMAQVDERLKRRFSVSASMEEISKIAEMKTLQSQTSLGPEQAALAQSQHFDQLEALWNKRSPPRRRHNTSLSRQSSLVEDRIESSDEDEFQEERTGMLKTKKNSPPPPPLPSQQPGKTGSILLHTRPHSLPIAAWNSSSDIMRHDQHNVQPDLVKDHLVPKRPSIVKSKSEEGPSNNGKFRRFRWPYGIRASRGKIKMIKSDNDLASERNRYSDGNTITSDSGEHCGRRSSQQPNSVKIGRSHSQNLSSTTSTSNNNNNNNVNGDNELQLFKRSRKKRTLLSRSCIAQ